jgi:hypothetical protein
MIDDIVTGVLVNVITATGARLGKAVLAISGRKVTDDLANRCA